jgi:hypothetical protein
MTDLNKTAAILIAFHSSVKTAIKNKKSGTYNAASVRAHQDRAVKALIAAGEPRHEALGQVRQVRAESIGGDICWV